MSIRKLNTMKFFQNFKKKVWQLLYISCAIYSVMGQAGELKKRKFEKKYKEILASRDLIEEALDFDKKLTKIKNHLKEFEKDLDPFKDKEQKKVRDFKI